MLDHTYASCCLLTLAGEEDPRAVMVERGLGVDKGELFGPPSPSPLLLLPYTASDSEGRGALACPKDDCSVPHSSQLVVGSLTRLDLCRQTGNFTMSYSKSS